MLGRRRVPSNRNGYQNSNALSEGRFQHLAVSL